MTPILRLAPAVLAAFLTRAIVPQVMVVRHHHAGGDHPHVHGGELVAGDDDHDDDHHHLHHHHHHDDLTPPDEGPGLEEPEHGDGWHTHWQLPYQRARRAAAPTVVPRVAVLRLAPVPLVEAGSRPALPPRSRGPPLPVRG